MLSPQNPFRLPQDGGTLPGIAHRATWPGGGAPCGHYQPGIPSPEDHSPAGSCLLGPGPWMPPTPDAVEGTSLNRKTWFPGPGGNPANLPMTSRPSYETSGTPRISPGNPDPYRNLGLRIGKYVRQVLGSDVDGLSAVVYGKAGREEVAFLVEGIALGSGTVPRLCLNGDAEICEIRCIFTAGAKRITVIPRAIEIPGNISQDRQLLEDFSGWLMVREDEELFEVRFG